MKKIFFLIIVLVSQFSNANWITSFEDGKKMALASNKFMIVDFSATWCGPCKKMDSESWSDTEVNQVLENYIQVKIDIDQERDLAEKYGIQGVPNMSIMDGNGKVLYSFSGYYDAIGLKRELIKFAFSTSFISNELITYYKFKSFSTSTRVYLKYLDYSLLVNPEVKRKIIDLASGYLDEAKKELSKRDEAYLEKMQRLELLKLFELAYDSKFEKISKKISEMNEVDIAESNKNFYYFLQYISSKALNSADLITLENNLKGIEGADFYVGKANFILNKNKT